MSLKSILSAAVAAAATLTVRALASTGVVLA
jgi:hypothetical protein